MSIKVDGWDALAMGILALGVFGTPFMLPGYNPWQSVVSLGFYVVLVATMIWSARREFA
jgi:hypothetical protein